MHYGKSVWRRNILYKEPCKNKSLLIDNLPHFVTAVKSMYR